MASHHGKTVGKSRGRFLVPGGVFYGELSGGAEPERQERNQGKEAEQDRRSPGKGLIGPLALGCQAQVGAGFLKRHRHRPAHDHPLDDLSWSGLEGRTEAGDPGADRSGVAAGPEAVDRAHPRDHQTNTPGGEPWRSGHPPDG